MRIAPLWSLYVVASVQAMLNVGAFLVWVIIAGVVSQSAAYLNWLIENLGALGGLIGTYSNILIPFFGTSFIALALRLIERSLYARRYPRRNQNSGPPAGGPPAEANQGQQGQDQAQGFI